MHWSNALSLGQNTFFLFKNINILLTSAQKHMLWVSSEVPHWDASNEYPQHMFSWRNKKNIIRIPLLSGTKHMSQNCFGWIITSDMMLFQSTIVAIFYFCTKTYVVGKFFCKEVLMRTPIIYFWCWNKKKYYSDTSSDPELYVKRAHLQDFDNFRVSQSRTSVRKYPDTDVKNYLWVTYIESNDILLANVSAFFSACMFLYTYPNRARSCT